MRKLNITFGTGAFRRALLLAVLLAPSIALAQWHAAVGAQSDNKARQAMAFLPNEIWIHAGDSITWSVETDEPHTVTFLKDGQVRPFFADGCPGFSSDPATFDGSQCVTSAPLVKGQNFTIKFPATGNYKLSCLFHESQDGTIHVYESSKPLPHDQAFYDQRAADERRDLLVQARIDYDSGSDNQPNRKQYQGVGAGTGSITATGGGSESLSLVRFVKDPVEIRPGQTVEWVNNDPVLPHTITFGTEPVDILDPSPDVTVDADGARHAVIKVAADSTHSGFIVAAPQERLGVAQAPLGTTRFRVTFPKAGTFPYICALHDGLGMTGTVIVKP
jgi:plastocyanin